ncbi:MAG TPA: alpha/beta fold hydrolase [Terriglobia bacterium]|nr:alpha/beta fold hydrolase [Terriglobia bacterium]
MSRLWLAVASAAVFLLAWTQSYALEPRRESGIFQIDPPTPYIHYLPSSTPRGRVLVVHGLDVSKEIMQSTSAALADGGFEVYNIDLPGHGDSPVGFQALLAEQAIQNVLAQIGEDSIVLGHSLGGGLLLDLSATRHFSTMVLLAPAPTFVPKIHADRALIVTGTFDIPKIRTSVPFLADVGAPNVEWWCLPWGGHGTPILSPVHIRHVVEWVGGDGQNVRSSARLIWISVMFIAGVALGATLRPGRELKGQPLQIPATLVRYAAACGVAILILKIVVPLAWLRLFTTDYLVSLLLTAGILLWVQERRSLHIDPIAILKGIGAAAFVIFVLGFGAGSQVLHMALSDGRWWRFPCIVVAGLPLLTFDEMMIRRIDAQWKRLAVAIITRALLWTFIVTGVLLLNRADAFLVLIAHFIVLFWILLWFAAGIVYRHTQDPLATAIFAAIVQGWAFAAWFVTI